MEIKEAKTIGENKGRKRTHQKYRGGGGSSSRGEAFSVRRVPAFGWGVIWDCWYLNKGVN